MSTSLIRAILADDEPLARARLRRLLLEEPDIRVVAECESGLETLEAMAREPTDVVFLDIQMPAMDGFEVVAALAAASRPAIVFVTAYDRYAVQAFEVHALDYLLKPFSRARLREAVARVRERIAGRDVAALDAHVATLLEEMRVPRVPRDRLVVRHDGRILFVPVSDVDWVEASANYVRVHARGESYALRETMRGMEARLPGDRFLRIHRSTIVNLDRVRELQPWFRGEHLAILHDGTKLAVSRSYAARIIALLG